MMGDVVACNRDVGYRRKIVCADAGSLSRQRRVLRVTSTTEDRLCLERHGGPGLPAVWQRHNRTTTSLSKRRRILPGCSRPYADRGASVLPLWRNGSGERRLVDGASGVRRDEERLETCLFRRWTAATQLCRHSSTLSGWRQLSVCAITIRLSHGRKSRGTEGHKSPRI